MYCQDSYTYTHTHMPFSTFIYITAVSHLRKKSNSLLLILLIILFLIFSRVVIFGIEKMNHSVEIVYYELCYVIVQCNNVLRQEYNMYS